MKNIMLTKDSDHDQFIKKHYKVIKKSFNAVSIITVVMISVFNVSAKVDTDTSINTNIKTSVYPEKKETDSSQVKSIDNESDKDSDSSNDSDTESNDSYSKGDKTKEEKPNAVKIDPVLLEIKEQLKLLLEGKLSEEISIESLFDVPLDSPPQLIDRLKALSFEQKTLSLSMDELQSRINNIESSFPLPEKSEILNTVLTPPVQPVAPVAPLKPDAIRPKGKLTPKRNDSWKKRYEEWKAYDEAHKLFETGQAEYDNQLINLEKEQEKYNQELEQQKIALEKYESALEKRNRLLEKRSEELLLEKKNLSTRIQISAFRKKYLTALNEWFQKLTDPATVALESLKKPRNQIRKKADYLLKDTKKIDSLLKRVHQMEAKARAGSFVGFKVQLDQIASDAVSIQDAIGKRKKSLLKESSSLKDLAVMLEKKGAGLRHLILINAVNKNRDEIIDSKFISDLQEMRRNSQKASFTDSFQQNSDSELAILLDKTLTSPDAIGTPEEAAPVIASLKALVERLDSEIDDCRIFKEKNLQVFRREKVTLLFALSTEKTRNQAYSLSKELIADLLADLSNLQSSIHRFYETKKDDLLRLPEKIKTREGITVIARMITAIILLLIVGLLRHKLVRIVSLGIRKFSRGKFFRHRVGSLVRIAGLAEALMPTMVVAGTLYLSLSLIGFNSIEVKFIEVAVRWTITYALGRHLLEGLTRRVSRGRPAFIPVTPEVSTLLASTYKRLGSVLCAGGMIYEWSNEWLGAGLLSTLIIWSVWTWLGLWFVWAFFTWRSTLAFALINETINNASQASETEKQKVLFKTGTWMLNHYAGAILSVPVLIILFTGSVIKKLKLLLTEGGIFAYLRARSLRRLARNSRKETPSLYPMVLPQRYINEFPLYPIYGEEDVVILPKQKIVDDALEQLEKWKITKQDSSLVLIGEKGVGKTTLLTLLNREIKSVPIIRHSIGKKLRTEKALVEELAVPLGITDPPPVIGTIAGHLNRGEECVILLDEGHNVFLRTVDGYEAYESLIQLVNFTSDKVFWVLVFNSFSWSFLNASRRRLHYFRKLQFLPSWTQDELFELISRRNKRSGFTIEFDEVLLDASRSVTGDFEVIDGAEGFFRLLWESSHGNPRVATRLWLEALTTTGDNQIRVGLFSESLASDLLQMDRELLFTLAAICQHENLSISELREVLNVSHDFAGFAVRFLSEYGLLEPKHTDPRRLTLAPRFYPQVLKLLRQHHLLFEKE
ncbi:MAG: AAA family ATPase [Deltaproteobacteria bacterium]|nr:AAA family ATPase [Deltaproteobacteria bacterium]